MAVAAAGVLTLVSVGCGSGSATASEGSPAETASNATLTVLESAVHVGTWPGLDPANDDNVGYNASQLDAIFGELFEIGANGKIIPDLATGYQFSNGGKTVTLTIRKGVKFSDGTPFNAAAVAYNWKRDLSGSCACKPTWIASGSAPIKTPGPYTVSITLSAVDPSFITALQGENVNYIASPTAIKKMGERAFALKPIGAGPFTVVSDTPSSVLVLKRNPGYWQKGLPYLRGLTFKTVANDESAYEAMLAGAGKAYEDITTPALVDTFAKNFKVTAEPAPDPYDVQPNTAIAPFNNILAREALYYATDAPLLDKKLYNDAYPVTESFLAPGGLFYEAKVPGYRTYNLAKAKAIVKKLGGLSFTLVGDNTTVYTTLMEALQSEWEQAGMKVTIRPSDLSLLIDAYEGKKWQAGLATTGSYDPSTGQSVEFRYGSDSAFSGTHDPTLDALMAQAAGTINSATRAQLYHKLAEYISNKAYSPYLFPVSNYNVVAKGVGGPGLSTPVATVSAFPEVLWQYVYNNSK